MFWQQYLNRTDSCEMSTNTLNWKTAQLFFRNIQAAIAFGIHIPRHSFPYPLLELQIQPWLRLECATIFCWCLFETPGCLFIFISFHLLYATWNLTAMKQNKRKQNKKHNGLILFQHSNSLLSKYTSVGISKQRIAHSCKPSQGTLSHGDVFI